MAAKKTHEQYEEELFNNEIDFIPLERYKSAHEKILHACINDHEWLVTPSHILNSRSGCPQCFKDRTVKANSEYLSDLVAAGITYEPLDVYVNNKTHLRHKCRAGHIFKATPDKILSRRGCPECNMVGGYNKTRFSKDRTLAESPGIMYIIVLVHKATMDRTCVKIGITKGTSNKDVLKRAAGFTGYEPRIQKLVHGTLEEVFNLEQKLHEQFIDYRYLDSHRFGGHTELFQIDKLPEILRAIRTEV